MPAPPTYRERLRVEGLALAAIAAVGAVVLAALDRGATDHLLSTGVQLAIVVAGLGWFAPRAVRKALTAAEPVEGAAAGSGEPTPLWHLPLVVVALATPFALAGSPDSVLRVLGGCTLVGVAQAAVLAPMVARAERSSGRVFVRRPGSRILRGTRLGWWAQGPRQDGALP